MSVPLSTLRAAVKAKPTALPKSPPPVPIAPKAAKPKPPKEDKAPRVKGTRKCCATVKGQNVPHEESCPTLRPRKPKKPQFTFRGRLPDGSVMQASYRSITDVEGTWTATLKVIVGGKEKTFQAERSALFNSFKDLDKQFWTWFEIEQAGNGSRLQ